MYLLSPAKGNIENGNKSAYLYKKYQLVIKYTYL